jgi:hypothetical protein
MGRFDLRRPAEAWYRYLGFLRWATLVTAVFVGILTALSVPQALAFPQKMWKPILLGAATCYLAWLASTSFAPFPLSLEIDGPLVRFFYPSGRSRVIRWSAPSTVAYLRDARIPGRVLPRALVIEACLESEYLTVIAPLTGEALDALLASARSSGARVSVRQIPRWYSLFAYYGGVLGTVYKVTGSGSL